MPTRRQFIQYASTILAAPLTANANAQKSAPDWRMPDESKPHQRTWMAFGAKAAIWGYQLLPTVQRNLATIANTISQYEPVSMLVRKQEYAIARDLLDEKVELIVAPLDDLWMRDTGPLFVHNAKGQKAALNGNFNGWGNKQQHGQDAEVADFVAARAGVETLYTDLVLEGGCIEVDGQGTAIITESCTLNDNRNPGVSKAQFEDELMPLLGLEKIIWLPGIKGHDITDGHTDFYARFAAHNVVLAGYDPDPKSFDHEITLQNLEILESATNAHNQAFDVKLLEAPTDVQSDHMGSSYAAGYIGFYVCNGAVVMQVFGDASADKAARDTIQQAFPGREIVEVNIDGIAAGGGSVHCATQQEPLI